jgi:hypothetical protein
LSASDVGAAPAGFGLGTEATWCGDCNEAVVSGWYNTGGSANCPEGYAYGWLLVSVRDSRYIRQDYYSCSNPVTHWERYRVDGVWQDWKNISPTTFAPAGYGLGEAELFSVANIDTITKPGWYYSNESTTIGSLTGNRWWMIVKAYGTGSTFATQEIHSFTSGTGYKFERYKINGTWGAWTETASTAFELLWENADPSAAFGT